VDTVVVQGARRTTGMNPGHIPRPMTFNRILKMKVAE
jgi:hypothetical protein